MKRIVLPVADCRSKSGCWEKLKVETFRKTSVRQSSSCGVTVPKRKQKSSQKILILRYFVYHIYDQWFYLTRRCWNEIPLNSSSMRCLKYELFCCRKDLNARGGYFGIKSRLYKSDFLKAPARLIVSDPLIPRLLISSCVEGLISSSGAA